MQGENHDFVPCWGIHSSTEGRPVFRGFGKTEAEALQKMEQLRATDPDNEATEYWVVQMNRHEWNTYQQLGWVPK